MDIFKRKPRNLDTQALEDTDLVDLEGGIAQNSMAARRQKLLLLGGGGLLAILATMWILDGEDAEEKAGKADGKTVVSTDALMNRQVADREWMSVYEHQLDELERRQKGSDLDGEKVAQLEAQIQALRGEKDAMVQDGTRVLDAYERENQQLKRQLEDARSRPSAPGPVAAASAMGVSPGSTSAPGSTVAATPRTKNVKLVSFGESSGTASRIDPGKGGTNFTDSPNYLPPNSIAKAMVVVGVDATTNTRSQSDPLPVLLRITGPARSVFDDGKLLATRVQGCMVNGAAYGDLSSEKVYVKLQRMTCPQPGGRFAVSEVKGFIAFGGKVGVRGRVVSREGGLLGQAFLAGLAGGFGRGFSANANSVFSGATISVDGKRQELSTGDILKGGLGEGMSTAGDSVSKYLIERAEQYQPVIEMPTGANVEVVFLDGTFVRN